MNPLFSALAQTWPARAAKSLYEAAKHPGEVYAGRADPMDVEKATDLAGLAMTGGLGGLGGMSGAALGSGPIRKWAKPKGHDSYTPVTVDVKKIDPLWQKETDMYIGPGGQGGIRRRYPAFGEWLEANPNTAIDMPRMGLGPQDMPRFGDGRHRFAYMRDQGATEIPVVVPHEDAEMFRRLFGP